MTVIWIPAAIEIHFANGEMVRYSRRDWSWDIGEGEVVLWKKDERYKFRYTGNIAVVEIFVPKREREEGKDAGSGAR